jgi:ABC-type branched-subunit amino acid transport system permease subunit
VDFVGLGQTVFAGVVNGALYALIGLGFSLISRSTGIINFAQGEFAMLGAMLTGILAGYGLPLALCTAVAMLACGAVSWLFYTLALRHADKATMSQLVIMTIGLSILIRGVVTSVWGSDPISVPAFTGSRPFNLLGISILPQALWLIGALVVVTALMWLFFQHTLIGLALRAGASNPLGAAFVGIDHKRLGSYSFIMAGLLGGLGGAVWAPIAFAQVDIGIALGLKGFTAAALGGFGTPFGPIAGGVLFGLVESISAGFVSSAYQDAISYGLLFIVLIVRPQGLLGSLKRDAMDKFGEEPLSSGLVTTHATRLDLAKFVLTAMVLLLLGKVLTGAWLTSAIFAGIMAIVVMGLVLLTGYAGQLSLGQGVFMMIGAYSSGFLTLRAGWPVISAIAFGMALSGVFALIVGRVIFRLQGYYLAMASLSLLMIGQTFARELYSITGGPNGLPGIPPLEIFGLTFFTDDQFYYVVIVFSLLTLAGGLSIARSRVGRALLAIRSDELAARAYGVDAMMLKIGSLVFSAASASLAGSLYVHYIGIANPAPFGFDASIFQVMALTLGGFLSLWGSYFGSAVVVALPSIIVAMTGESTSQSAAGLQYLCFGLLLIAVILAQTNSRAKRIARYIGPLMPHVSWRLPTRSKRGGRGRAAS